MFLYAARFDGYELGLGNVPDMLNKCYNYYKFVDKVLNGDYTGLWDVFTGAKDIDFNDPSIKENATKQAAKMLKSASEKLAAAMQGEPEKKKGFSIWSLFNCPVEVTVYDSSGQRIGYVGEDDLWFNSDNIYIEQIGETKAIYSRDDSLTFELVATDYGNLNCTFEEYDGEKAIRRINYYDIPLYAGKTISAEIPSEALSTSTVHVTEKNAGQIVADENISAAEYGSSTVNISCIVDPVGSGQVLGVGEYIRGDTVKLHTLVNGNNAFLGWKDNNGSLVSISPNYKFVAKENLTLTALFADIGDENSTDNTDTPTTQFAPIDFTDVQPSAYYYDAVAWAVENGITYGITDTTFGPDVVCTRAQIVTFLWRTAGSPVAEGTNPFMDVTKSDYYYDAVLWAVANGITAGTTETTFSPNEPCTRAQAVSFLYRAKSSPVVSGTNRFTDLVSGAYYTDAVQWAVTTGVTAGTSTTTFSPNQNCTRAQIVSFLYRDRSN